MSGAGNVTFKLNVDATSAKQGAGAARDALKETGAAANSTKSAVDGTTKSLKDLERQSDATSKAGERIGIALGAGLTAVAAGYLALSGKAIKSIDDIYVASQRLGASTEFLSTLDVAARQNGVGVDRLNTALNLFSTNVAKAAGGSRVQTQLFDQMGVSVKDSAGQFKSLEQLIPEIANKFATYKDGPEKAALANKLFGESGSELLPLLNQLGDEGFAKVEAAAASMGLVIDKQTAKAAHDFNDQLTALKLTTEGYFNKVAADVLPNLVAFAKGLADTAKSANDVNDKTTILGNGIRAVATWFVEAYGAAQAFGVGIGEAVAEAEIGIDKLKTRLTDSGYREALAGAILGDGNAIAALDVFEKALDQKFSGKVKAAQLAADASFSEIDKNVASRVSSINRNINTMGDALGNVTKPRTGNAPFADLDRTKGPKDNSADALQAQINFANSLAEKVGGPLAEAYQKYSDALDRADVLADRSRAAHVAETFVVAQLGRAYTNATLARDKDITSIKLHNEANDAFVIGQQKIQDALGKYVESLNEEIGATEDRIKAGHDLTEVEQAELFIKKNLTDASGKVSAAHVTEAGNVRKLAAELQKLHAEEKLGDDLAQVFLNAAQAVGQGEDAFRSLGQAALPVLHDIAQQILKIVDANDEAVSGVSDFQAAMDGVGATLDKVLPAIGQLVGTTAGGGGQNAALGSALGGAIGLIVTAGNPIGGAIGATIGGIIGGQFDHQRTYSARVSGAGRPDETTTEGPFGTINAGQAGDNQDPNLVGKIRDFDKLIAGILPPELMQDVTDRIQAFNGSFSSIDQLFAARFDVVLKALDPVIGDFVKGFSSDLQTEIQALADVFNLQKLENAGLLITDSLSDALGLITKFGQSGERVADTYARLVASTSDYQTALQLMGVAFDGSKTQLVEFAQNVADAAGGTQAADALWQEFFKDFYSQAEITAGNITLLQAKTNDSLSKIGLDGSISMEDFRTRFKAALPTLTPEEIANWLQAGVALGELNNAITALINQGEALVDQLYGGGSLSDVNSQIAALQGTQNNAAQSTQHLGSAISTFANNAKAAANLLLGALSPLNDQQKLQYAIQGLRNGTVTQEQVLTIGRQLYASSQAYNQLFAMVRAIGDHTGATSGGSGGSSSSSSQGSLSAADQTRLTELEARRDTLQAQQRKQQARDLAVTVAQLGLTQKESFSQVADELGFNLKDLAKDLGLTSDQLTTYLQNIQAQQSAVPDAVSDGSNRVVRALYDIAGRPPPSWALDTPTNADGTPLRGHSQHASRGRGTLNVPDSLASSPGSPGNTATFVDAQVVANAKLDQILAAVNRGTAATIDVAKATRTVNTTLRSTPARRNARAGA